MTIESIAERIINPFEFFCKMPYNHENINSLLLAFSYTKNVDIVHFIIICVNKINIKNRITTTKIETNKKQHKNLNTSDTNLFNTKNRHERLQINNSYV